MKWLKKIIIKESIKKQMMWNDIYIYNYEIAKKSLNADVVCSTSKQSYVAITWALFFVEC